MTYNIDDDLAALGICTIDDIGQLGVRDDPDGTCTAFDSPPQGGLRVIRSGFKSRAEATAYNNDIMLKLGYFEPRGPKQ